MCRAACRVALAAGALAVGGCGSDGGSSVPSIDAAPIPADAAVFEPVDVALVRLSVAANGAEASAASVEPTLSADGRFAAFVSSAPEFAADGNGSAQVYVVDRESGAVERASVTPGGAAGGGDSTLPALSDDGRTVAFASAANDLVAAGARVGFDDVFLRDLDTEVTALASAGLERDASRPSLDGSGGIVVFDTVVTASTPTGPRSQTRVMTFSPGDDGPVELTGDGVAAALPDISGDSAYVAFAIGSELWRYDRATRAAGRTTRVIQAEGLEARFRPSIDATGDRIALTTGSRVFVVLVGNQTVRGSETWDGRDPNGPCTWPSLSGDGRFIAFACDGSDLVPDDENAVRDVFVRDLDTERIARLSIAADRTEGDGPSDQPFISRDGRFIVFSSAASNLVDGDDNGVADVFVATNPLL